MWIARDKDETLWLFEEMPQRITGDIYKDDGWWCDVEDTSRNMSYCMLDSNLFPDLKWEDEPREVVLVEKSSVYNFERAEREASEEYIQEVIQEDRQDKN